MVKGFQLQATENTRLKWLFTKGRGSVHVSRWCPGTRWRYTVLDHLHYGITVHGGYGYAFNSRLTREGTLYTTSSIQYPGTLLLLLLVLPQSTWHWRRRRRRRWCEVVIVAGGWGAGRLLHFLPNIIPHTFIKLTDTLLQSTITLIHTPPLIELDCYCCCSAMRWKCIGLDFPCRIVRSNHCSPAHPSNESHISVIADFIALVAQSARVNPSSFSCCSHGMMTRRDSSHAHLVVYG